MHLQSVHRSSYYAAKPSSTLVRRDADGGNTHNVVVAVLVVLMIVGVLAVGPVLIGKIKSEIQNKRYKARGEGSHLERGSLRRHKRPGNAASNNTISPAPHSDWRIASELTAPQSAYAASPAFSQQAGRVSMPPHPEYRNDGFEPTPSWSSGPQSPFAVVDLPPVRSQPRGNWI